MAITSVKLWQIFITILKSVNWRFSKHSKDLTKKLNEMSLFLKISDDSLCFILITRIISITNSTFKHEPLTYLTWHTRYCPLYILHKNTCKYEMFLIIAKICTIRMIPFSILQILQLFMNEQKKTPIFFKICNFVYMHIILGNSNTGLFWIKQILRYLILYILFYFY